jgi:nucleoside 2-deoxyribosyltransferase
MLITFKNYMKAYLAGPLGFDAPGRMYMDKMIDYLSKELPNLEVINPFKLTPTKDILDNGLKKMSPTLYKNDINALIESDLVIAVLNGPQVDDGTAYELGYFKGYFAALGVEKKIIAYRDDFRNACNDGNGVDFNIMVNESIIHPVAHNMEELMDIIKSNI